VLGVIKERPFAGKHAIDLGTGSGALAVRLRELGYDTIVCDADPDSYGADLPFLKIDFDNPGFAQQLGPDKFDLVTAIEVIEHVEAPVSFLRNIHDLLRPKGVAIVTTPNMDSLPSRLKFLLKGKLRLMDKYGDPTHISPIFWDLLASRYLTLAGLSLVAHHVYPPDGFVVGRPLYRRLLSLVNPLMAGSKLLGDNHVLILARAK